MHTLGDLQDIYNNIVLCVEKRKIRNIPSKQNQFQ